MSLNGRLFDAGMKVADVIIKNHLTQILLETAEDYLADLAQEKEFIGFTGNTQTSYTCGLFVNGRLDSVIVQSAWPSAPIRLKVQKGEFVFLDKPYEGRSRSVRGKVDVDSLTGQASAAAFLKSYKGVVKKGYELVVTTGTEYSEYIENVYKLNVMTGTWQHAAPIISSNIKPIK